MQTLGDATAPERYARFTIKERILAEIHRLIETKDWSLATVNFAHVVRYPLTENERARKAPFLCIIDADEQFGGNTTGAQNEVTVQFDFGLKCGAKEVPSTVLNLVAGELMERLCGNHQMPEGGKQDGERLSCIFAPVSYEPDVEDASTGGVVSGLLTFRLTYRHRMNRPFELR